jgi:hypothetical protein
MEEGNIDRDRIVDDHLVPDEYFCAICRCLLWKPRASATCRHLFCQKCIRTWLENPNSGKRCPFRCEAYEERRCSPDVYSVLYYLNIRCRNTPLGCTQIVPYTSLEEHENNECEYLTQRCSECEQLVLRSELDEHREIPGLCVPQPLKCVVCRTYIEKPLFKDHFHNCFKQKIDALVAESFGLHNVRTTANGEQVASFNWLAVISNWLNTLNLLEQQRQLSQVPTNLIGVDAVRQARERHCGFVYHILMILTFILANGSKAAFFILLFSFIGFIQYAFFIFIIYSVLIVRIGARIYRGCCLIMICSYILSYGISFIFRFVSDSLIIYLFGLFIFLYGCSNRAPLEVFEMNDLIHMRKMNIGLCCGGLLIMKVLLLFGRFYNWCIPTYFTAGIISWINFYFAFRTNRLSRNTTPPSVVQTLTTT